MLHTVPKPRSLSALLAWAASLLLYLFPTHSPALDGVMLGAGDGSGLRPATPGRAGLLALVWDWGRPAPLSDGWERAWSVEASALWLDAARNDVRALGLSVFVRAARRHLFFEAGVGVHQLSDDHYAHRDLGTQTQFGPTLGMGASFGAGRYEIGWRLLHLSNAGLARPNPGLNFHMLRFGYRF